MIESSKVLYEDDEHQFIWFGWEEKEEEESLVQSNQALVINGEQAYLFDPGGAYIFSEVAAEINKYISLDQIRYLLASHQDPDVLSSVTLWLKATPAKLLVSNLWTRFVSHFGFSDNSRLIGIDDKGQMIKLPKGGEIKLLPSHFMHSEGNFTFYDTRSKILFSGDIGASVFPKGERYLFAEDWETHKTYMEGFHRRYMGGKKVTSKWSEMVRKLPLDMIVPQHGAIIPQEMINTFLDWLGQLDSGLDIIDEIYGF